MVKGLRKLAYLLYIGTMLSRMHLSSYIVSCLSTVLWFLVVFIPVMIFSPDPVKAFRTFLPGMFAMGAAALGMWVATEFTRWYVYQGLTDMFRECGLNVLHYMVCGMHIDLGLANIATFLLSAVAMSISITGSITLVIPHSLALFLAAIASSIAPYLLCGSLAAYLYAKTRASGTWTNVLQMLLVVGTVIPPSSFPKPEVAFANPATIVAELMRAAYGSSTIPLSELYVIAPIALVFEVVMAIVIAKASEKEIAKHGLEYRV